MNQPLKAGDLCLIIRSVAAPENVGKSVTLVAKVEPGEVYQYGKFIFHNRADLNYGTAWFVEGDHLVCANFMGDSVVLPCGLVRQVNLLKINPDDKLKVRDKEQEKEHA